MNNGNNHQFLPFEDLALAPPHTILWLGPIKIAEMPLRGAT